MDSVDAVENLIREYDDFLATLDAQDPKFDALKKLTLLEQAFDAQRHKEAEMQQQRQKTTIVEAQKKEPKRKVGFFKIVSGSQWVFSCSECSGFLPNVFREILIPFQ